MTESMVVRGFVASDPLLRTLDSGLHVCSFRLGSTPRRFDRAANAWVDGETNWYTVSCFRELAVHAHASIRKGQPALVLGRLKVRHFQRQDGSPGVSVEIEADTLGHDLRWGVGSFGRTQREAPLANAEVQVDPAADAAAHAGSPEGDSTVESGSDDAGLGEDSLLTDGGEVVDRETGVVGAGVL